ncbi:hypothetical protein FNV43_RR10592 [Rhamnella rubrinervis]|uniref:Uncharacterized protein n=1 Tax=Rhamnella rubrinervis TaxID=2594499 RepID=A0A8K0MGV4_9ROSA|nr:hypothetical protein FNV43_RR10592 [Rhamnella rubrinervis]
MAVAGGSGSNADTPLLDDTVLGVTDYKGLPVLRSKSGGWRSAGFIIGVEVAERFAYYGIGSNLINYLTGPLGQSTAMAAENVNTWSGMASLLPLLGAFVADLFFGRYRTIIVASLLYILGLGLLTVSAVLSSSVNASLNQTNKMIISASPQFQLVLFFFSLYLVAIAQGGHKPCVQAFGADQFDGQDPKESKAKSSFFNWWYFGLCAGASATILIVSYIQENLSWGLGFGVPCIAMVVALIVFLLGTTTYRYTNNIVRDKGSPFVRIGKVFISAFRNWRIPPSAIIATDGDESREVALPQQSYEQFKFLNKALFVPNGLTEDGKTNCSISEVEEAKAVLRLVPIWGTCLAYGIVYAQSTTFFTKQGATMERRIVPGFDLPAASLQSLIGVAIVLFVPIYDRILVPVARECTRNPFGITMLQRIGTGMVLSTLSMVVAALVEMKRLKTAQEYDLVDSPSETVPMSLWWLAPQYLLFGIADVFTLVGLQEFFYDQVPNELRSIGMALYLSIIGVGSFLSSFIISGIDKATGGVDKDSCRNFNLNGCLDAETPLLFDTVEGVVDYNGIGQPVLGTRSGGWRKDFNDCHTMLQRIGAEIALSVLRMAVAAINEMKRLKMIWMISQVPSGLRSSFVISPIDQITGGSGRDSWFSTNLNRAHVDYFYWLLAVLSAIGLSAYMSVEEKSLKITQEYNLVDTPSETIPVSLWRFAPQHLLFGKADAFTLVSLQEFFYDQMQSYLNALSLWESILSDIDPALLVANSTLNQIRQHEEEKSKKPKALSCIHAALSDSIFSRIIDCV